MTSKDAEKTVYLIHDRETHRYLEHASVKAYINNIADEKPTAHPSRDRVLTALVQSTLSRLGAHRAFVSLLDNRHQYIIAEATTTSNLQGPKGTSSQGDLILCGLAFPYSQGVAHHVLQITSESILESAEPNQNQARLPCYVISDIQNDSRFASSQLVKYFKDLRFHASVPLRTQTGFTIGIMAVTDSVPRSDLSDDEKQFLHDMSLTVVEHLTLLRYRREEARGKRMMRGLGSFVEGMSTMSGLVADQWSADRGNGDDAEGVLNVAQQISMQSPDEHVNDTATDGRRQATGGSYFDATSNSRYTSPTTTSMTQTVSSMEDIPQISSENFAERYPLLHSKGLGGDALEQSHSGLATESLKVSSLTPSTQPVHKLFSRAANTIREAIEVEGVLFFDAGLSTSTTPVDTVGPKSSYTKSSYSSHQSSSGDDSAQFSRSDDRDSQDTKMCEVFGFSTTEFSSIDGEVPNANHLSVPQRFLRLLLRRYPEGKIFNFDEHGIPLSDTDSDGDYTAPAVSIVSDSHLPQSRKHRKQAFSRAREPSYIIKVFPGARSVIAFPLWDSHRVRWFAGGVAWTRTPNRIFSVESELSYLRAFGATIMAEVAKIDAQQMAQAKSDVLGSISHELRSPLHGILGGVDLLKGMDMSVFQISIVHSIEKCGTTLLDTISHLLEYAKVNNLMRVARERHSTSQLNRDVGVSSEAERDDTAELTDVAVDAVIEEVIESIFIGHEFEQSSHQINNDRMEMSSPFVNIQNSDTSGGTAISNQVKVILDIYPNVNWKFRTQVGALRRVIMNIFGNALKYTSSGQIRVTTEQPQPCRHATEVSFTIEDSGKGISQEYLAHHLFTPFSQEDPLSSGTGLGLSITKTIVNSMGGTINARSQVGQGTTLSVTLPLQPSKPTDIPHADDEELTNLTSRTKGLRVRIFGYDEIDIPAKSSLSSQGWQLPMEDLVRLCQQWLRMDTLLTAEKFVHADIYVSTLAGSVYLSELNKAGTLIQPVVVICPNARTARQFSIAARTLDQNGIFEYIAQPCGPRKLGRSLVLALDRWAAIQVDKATQSPFPISTKDNKEHLNTQGDTTTPGMALGTTVPNGSKVPLPMGTFNTDPSVEHLDLSQSTSHNISDSITKDESSMPHDTSYPLQPFGSTPSPVVAPFLIVDDNDINLKILSAYLKRQNLPFVTATDGLLAVTAYEAARGVFSCIFMDIQMPRLDGMAATRKIRQYESQERLRPVHIVMLTGLATLENIQEAKAGGADEVFSKPVRLKGLDPIIAKTKRILDTKDVSNGSS